MPAVSCVPLADTKIAFAFYNKIRRITMRIGSGCHMEGAEIKLEELSVYGSRAAIIQNLKDAGCSQETIDGCLACLNKRQKKNC